MVIMSRQEKLLLLALACGTTVNAFAYIGCSIPLGIIQCAGTLQSISFITFVLSSTLSAAYLWIQCCKKHRTRKTQLAYTGMVVCVAVLAALAISQITTVHDMSVFCITLITVWISLLATNQLRWALVNWSLFAALLGFMMAFIHHDHPMVISLLCALLPGGAILYHTSTRKLSEWEDLTVVGSICALTVIMGVVAVIEMGMPPEGYGELVWHEAVFRATPYADGIRAVVTGFFGLSPFFYLIAKDSRGPSSKT